MLDINNYGKNVFKVVEGKVDDIIETFVSYYGEKYRDKITERINGATMFFTSGLDYDESIKYYVNFYEDQCRLLTMEAVAKVSGNNKFDVAFSIKSLCQLAELVRDQRVTDFELIVLKTLIKNFKLTNSKDLPKNANLVDLTVWLSNMVNRTELYNAIIKSIQVFNNDYLDLYNELQEEKSNATQIFVQLKQREEKIVQIHENARTELLKGYLLALTGCSDDKLLKKHAKTLFAIIKKGKADFIKLSFNPSVVHKKYIELFNFLGINHGKSINSYKVDSKLTKLLFNQDLIDSINDGILDQNADIIDNDKFFSEIVKKIKKLPIKGGNLGYVLNAYDYIFQPSTTEAYTSFYIDNENNLKSLVVCHEGVVGSDATLFHELNHVVTANLTKLNKNEYYYKTGILPVVETFNNLNFESAEQILSLDGDEGYLIRELDEEAVQDPTQLNEVINDYLSLEITKLAKQRGLSLTPAQDIVSSYSYAFPAFKNFIENNKEELKEIIMSEDKFAFQKHFGKENFKALSQIANSIILDVCSTGKASKICAEIKTKMGLSPHYKNSKILEELLKYSKVEVNWSNDFKNLCEMYRHVEAVDKAIALKKQRVHKKEQHVLQQKEGLIPEKWPEENQQKEKLPDQVKAPDEEEITK